MTLSYTANVEHSVSNNKVSHSPPKRRADAVLKAARHYQIRGEHPVLSSASSILKWGAEQLVQTRDPGILETITVAYNLYSLFIYFLNIVVSPSSERRIAIY